jgi:NodT family efflux transporter outer membrane factor (OMF) lipoprotein
MSIFSRARYLGRRGITVLSLCLTAVLALLQGGCGTSWSEWIHNGFKVGPNYKKPPAPLPEHWIEANDPHVNPHDPNLTTWWDVFNDPMLSNLIQRAYPGNLSLRAAAYRVYEARANLAIAVGELLPQSQTANASYTRREISLNGAGGTAALGTTGAAFGTGGVPTGAGTGSTAAAGGFNRFSSNWATSLNLSWELDFWGKFRRAVEAADSTLDASVENYDEALVILLSNVATQYVQYRTLQRRLELARINVSQQEPLVEISLKQMKEETADSIPSYYQLKSNLESTKALIPQLETQLRAANDQLCLLLGIPVRDLAPILGDGREPGKEIVNIPHPISEMIVVGIPGQMLLRRPDVRAAERNAKAQSAQIGVAEAEWYPHIAINGSLGLSANRFALLFDQRSWTGSIGPSLSWNILNYGRILANVRLQDATFLELVMTYQNTVLTANQEAEDAMLAYLNALVRSKNLTDSAVAARKASDYLRNQFEKGFVPKGQTTSVFVNRLFTALNFTVTQEDIAAQAQGDIALNLILLYRALGGGWQIRLQDLLPNGKCAPRPPDDGGFLVPGSLLPPIPQPLEPLPQPSPLNPAGKEKTPSPAPETSRIPAAILRAPDADHVVSLPPSAKAE